MVLSWIRNSRYRTALKHTSRSAQPASGKARLAVELLEDRLTPSPTIFSGVGAQAAPELAAFKAAIGGPANTAPTPQPAGYRTINWDNVAIAATDGAFTNNVIVPGHTVGVPVNRFQTQGVQLRDSYAVANDGFASTNTRVAGLFPAFSAPNVVAPDHGSTTMTLDFVAPSLPGGTTVPATVRGFGAVFLNTETDTTSAIEFFSGTTSLGKFYVAAAPAGTAQFLGVLLDTGSADSVQITLGSGAIFSYDGKTVTSGGADNPAGLVNLVAADDFVFSEPVAAASAPLTITPAVLPAAQTGVSYTQPFTTTGGTGSLTYAVDAGTLPPGLLLSPSGTLSGIPSASGTFSFAIKATDASHDRGSQAYSFTVSAPTLTVGPATLPGATSGTAYSQPLTAGGGTGPYSFALTSGTLPIGLTLAPAGTLSGTPKQPGSFNIIVQATDHFGAQGSQSYTLNVSGPVITLSPAALPSADANSPYSQTLMGSGGVGPYGSFALVAGSAPLPAGLTLSPAGVLSGTPTVTGTSTFTVQAQDSSVHPGPYVGTQTVTLTVNAALGITAPASLPGGFAGTAYNQTITATGGTAPYTTVAVSNFSAGTTGLSASAVTANLAAGTVSISGTPTAAGTLGFTVKVIDSAGVSLSQNYTVPVVANAPLALTPTTLPADTVGIADTASITATGGTGSRTLKLTNYTDGGTGLAAPTLSGSTATFNTTPAAAGMVSFDLAVSDSSNATVSHHYTIAVNAPVHISTTSLATAWALNKAGYGQQINTTGGTGAITFTLSTGALPPGLTFSSSGVVRGTPTAAGNYTFAVTARDTLGSSASQTYTIAILPSNFSYNATTGILTVSGTNFTFAQTTAADGNGVAHTTYMVTMDGTTIVLPDTVVTQVVASGTGSANTATLYADNPYNGTEAPQIVELWQNGGELVKYITPSSNYAFLILNGFSTTAAFLGRSDIGELYATAGVTNAFVTHGIYGSMSSAGQSQFIWGAKNLYGYAENAADYAMHYDGTGPSNYTASGTLYSFMSGTDTVGGQTYKFGNEALSFRYNTAQATHGGDTAVFYDSANNDFFVGNTASSYMASYDTHGNLNEFDQAIGFALVEAYSFVGGVDYAYNHDGAHNYTVGYHVLA